MRVKPAIPGTIVRDPRTRQLIPDEGAKVRDNSYWHRRLMAGEIVLIDETAPAPEPESEPEPSRHQRQQRPPAKPTPASEPNIGGDE